MHRILVSVFRASFWKKRKKSLRLKPLRKPHRCQNQDRQHRLKKTYHSLYLPKIGGLIIRGMGLFAL
jgi:hypothetical protein